MKYFIQFIFFGVLAFILLSTTGYAQSELTLHLTSEGTDIAVDSAEVAIMQSDIKTLSDENGKATISGLEQGFYLLSIKNPNYADQTLTLSLQSNQNLEKNIQLVPQLNQVLVTADRIDKGLEQRGFYKRKEQGSATFLTPEDIKKKEASYKPIDIFRNIPGINLKRVNGGLNVVSGRKKSDGKILESAKPCILDVYLDGGAVGGSIGSIVNSVKEVAAVEIYKGPATLPPRFNNFNSCGAIIIWTKSGIY